MHATMTDVGDLELIDCGDGRRLERFGDVVVDRPAPAAVHAPAPRGRRVEASAPALERRGAGRANGDRPGWTVNVGGLRLECRPAAGGQVGLFPEHAATWGWLDGAVRAAAAALGRPPELLSLFGYTGGPTLACARAGARVTHVDASQAGGRVGAPERGGFGPRGPARPLARRRRAHGRPPRAPPGQALRRRDRRSADLRARRGGLEDRDGPRRCCSTTSRRSSVRARRSSCSPPTRPGFDGERLAALCREHLGVAAASGEMFGSRATSGNVLRLGSWARTPIR